MGKFPQHSLATKRKRNANAQKCRLPCVKSEMTACLGNDIGQKKQWPQIERKGLFFGLGKAIRQRKSPAPLGNGACNLGKERKPLGKNGGKRCEN
jgi:hypothetical protein